MKWVINAGTGELEPINSAKLNLGQRFNLGGLAGRVKFSQGTPNPHGGARERTDLPKIKIQSTRVSENIISNVYEDKNTKKKIIKYKPLVGSEKATVTGEGFDTLDEAKKWVKKYRRENPKKVVTPAHPSKKYIQKKEKASAIKSKGGTGTHTGTIEVHKGHGSNVWGPKTEVITGQNIIYTPKKINVQMAGDEGKHLKTKSRFLDLDFKIADTSEKIEKIKKNNMSLSKKKIELQKLDNKLVNYAIQSDGYKVVTLSDGSKFTFPGKSTQVLDMMNVFPGKSEKYINDFVKKWAKRETWKNQTEFNNIKKARIFLANVENAKANAAKVAKKIIKEEPPKQPLKKTDFSKKTVVMMRMRDGLAKLYNKIPLKGVRLGASSTAAVLDYSFFHYVMGVPSAAAATGAALWFVKNPKEAAKISSALMAMSAGEMSVDDFIGKHGATLVGISSDAVLSETPPKETGPMVWKQGKLEIADEMARGGLSGVDQYIINRGI